MSETEETDKATKVVITDSRARSTPTPCRRGRLRVKKGDEVQSGEQLNEGSVYPHDLLAYAGKGEADRRTATELYLIREVQKVYKPQGVDINDKHIEIIVRQMKKVQVEQKGDTTYLPGQYVDRNEMLRTNAGLKKNKKNELAQPTRSSSASPRPRWPPTRSSRRPRSRRPPRCSRTRRSRAGPTGCSA